MKPKLDTMNHPQRAMFARKLYGNIQLKTETAAQRYALAQMFKIGGAK